MNKDNFPAMQLPAILILALCLQLLAGCNGISTQQKANPYYSRSASNKLELANSEWKKVLPADVYYIARKGGTERAFSNVYHDHHDKGTYHCAACGNPLFESEAKFESGTGWPSFYQPIRTQGSVTNRRDADGFRDEVRCARCDAHLGHVFEDGPEPTGLRYCMNGSVLHFAASQ